MKKVLLPTLLALGMVAVVHSAARAANTTFVTVPNGQQVFPISPPNQANGTPGAIDNMAIGQTTPAPGKFSTLDTNALSTSGSLTALPPGGNSLTVSGSAGGGVPSLTTAGVDTNVSMNLATKGSGGISFTTGGTVRLTISNTDLLAGTGYAPANSLSLATKTYVDTNALRSITASRRIAAGVASITGTGTAATGLTTIVACFLTINVGTAPGLGTSVVTYTTTGATLNLFAWKPTDATNPTLIAATAAASIAWTCIGT